MVRRMGHTPVPVRLGSREARTTTAGRFLLTDACFAPGTVLPRHYHDRPIVAVTLAGAWRSVVGVTGLEMTAGDVHVEPAGDSHSNAFGREGARVLVLQPDPLDEIFRPCASVLRAAARMRVAGAETLAMRIGAELARPDSLSPLAIESLALQLVADAARMRERRTAPLWIRTITDFMHAHFLEPLTLADLSAAAGLHPAHFGREFRRHHRATPAAYLRQLRLGYAADRLRRSALTIAEIALACGFADQSHFTRAFTRAMRTTPAAYRRASNTAAGQERTTEDQS
jgi:AraC family transcriptional regulator